MARHRRWLFVAFLIAMLTATPAFATPLQSSLPSETGEPEIALLPRLRQGSTGYSPLQVF